MSHEPSPDFVLDIASFPPWQLPPALRARLLDLFSAPFRASANLGPHWYARFESLYEAGEDVWSSVPSLEDLGHAMLDARNLEATRSWGCTWLTLFPSRRTVDAMAAILADPSEPASLRDQAAWTLGFRQIQRRHDTLVWSPDALATADDALLDAFEDPTNRSLPQLAAALRHVARDDVLDALAERPLDAAACIDAFCSPVLARALLARLEEVSPEHGARVIRLIAHTLRDEATAPLLAYADTAPVAEKTEALFAVLAVDPARGKPAADAFVASLAFKDRALARARWHEAHPGVIPTIEALRVARVSAVIAPDARDEQCAAAARHFHDAQRADMLLEGYLIDLWRHVAYRSRASEPEALAASIEAATAVLGRDPRMRDGYLEVLATLGRFDALEAVAREHGGVDRAVWLLASRGRPMRALGLRTLAANDTPWAVAGEALALFLAGRPDLATRVVEHTRPTAEPLVGFDLTPSFPGPEEYARMSGPSPDAPVLRALAERTLEPLFGAMQTCADSAQPDTFDMSVLAPYDATIPGDLDGATVYLAGTFDDAPALRATLEARGALLVAAPFGKTTWFVKGHDVDPQTVANLIARGAKPLSLDRPDDRTPQESSSRMNPLPHRITFLPTSLVLPAPQVQYEQPAALLLFTTLFEHFLRHPRVAMIDPDDLQITDPDNVLLTAQHPRIANVKAYEFFENRRDEVLWFEISLDPARPAAVRLKAERATGTVDDFAAIGSPASLSDAMQNCINQWLAARSLPPAPRPLETFTAQDFLQVVDFGLRLMQANAQNPQSAQSMFQVPPKLAVPFCRFAGITLGMYVWNVILKIEADNPWALRDDHLDRWHKGTASRDEVRQILRLAPAWGKPYGVMWGKGVTDDEWLYYASIDAALIPGNSFALDNYASALRTAGRREEAIREVDRATALAPAMLDAHMRMLDLLDDSMRYGEMLLEADRRLGIVDEMIHNKRRSGAEPDVCHIRLRYANALHNVGRNAEACQLRDSALKAVFNQDQWPKMREVLVKWQTDPREIAGAYAREGHFRGDPGRVVDGLGKTAIDRTDHLSMLVESLIALGKHDLALLAFARASRTRPGKTPRAWLAGARAHLANGQIAPALEYLVSFQIRAPQEPVDSEVHRLLRLAAVHPLAQWEAAVSAQFEAGARRIAKLVARDAADFVPGAAQSKAIQLALGANAPFAFDPASLGPLRAALTEHGLERIDQFFAAYTQPTLEHADRLVSDWTQAVAPDDGKTDEAFARHTAHLLYTCAHAITRYLALASQPGNPLGSGYRALACEMLSGLRRLRVRFPDKVIRPLLEALERASAVDDWIFDAWLLRLERALDLETSRGAHLAPLVDGLLRVGTFLRGNERVATEYRTACDSEKNPARAAIACAMYERCLRAFGGNVASSWSDAAVTSLPPEQALDVHWTALLANPFNAGPAVNAARALFQFQRPALAFDALVKRIGRGGKDWRAGVLAGLKPAWDASRFAVPLDFAQAQSRGYEHLQSGRFDAALQCYQWCDAIDPGNVQILRNLGFVHARLGRTFDCIAVASESDVAGGPGLAGHTLLQAGNAREAVRAYHLAALGTNAPDAWLYLASAANQAENDELCVEAYTKVFHLTQGAGLDGAHLNAFAGALDNVGDAVACEQIARRLMDVARGDAALTACATHHIACAYLALKRFPEAVQHAQQALQSNPLPENRPVFTETLERAQRGDPRPVPTRPLQTPEGLAFAALESGDFRAAQALAQSNGTWKVWRAAMAAYEFRYESDNLVPCTKPALECATWLLGSTAGLTDADAVLVRLRALRTREGSLIATDPPPLLGARMPREQFQQMFAPRAGAGAIAPNGGAGAPASASGGGSSAADMVLLPGTKLPRLVDYANLIKAMRTGGNPMTVVAKLGMDMATYGTLSTQWAQKIAADPNLAQRFQELISG